jgi:kynurenine formamidase
LIEEVKLHPKVWERHKMKNYLNLVFVALAAMGGYLAAIKNIDQTTSVGFEETLKTATFVELSHTLSSDLPDGPGPSPTIEVLRSHEPDIGIFPQGGSIHRYSFPGQWGTHIDAPIHFVGGKRTTENIPLSEMILPLIVFDIHEQVLENPDYQITLHDVAAWEEINGLVPEKTFVALRTDWSKKWPDINTIRNWDADHVSHTPGWSKEVLDYLVNIRNITAIGHETLDTDIGMLSAALLYPLETYYLGLDKYQIESMKSLDQLPPIGAYIVATWALAKDGAGFPARVFAIIPENVK